MSDTKPTVVKREDLPYHKGLVAGYQVLWGGEEPPISYGTFAAAVEEFLKVRQEWERKLADEEERKARALEYLAFAASSDTHSSDVDPGRVDPWEER